MDHIWITETSESPGYRELIRRGDDRGEQMAGEGSGLVYDLSDPM